MNKLDFAKKVNILDNDVTLAFFPYKTLEAVNKAERLEKELTDSPEVTSETTLVGAAINTFILMETSLVGISINNEDNQIGPILKQWYDFSGTTVEKFKLFVEFIPFPIYTDLVKAHREAQPKLPEPSVTLAEGAPEQDSPFGQNTGEQ